MGVLCEWFPTLCISVWSQGSVGCLKQH